MRRSARPLGPEDPPSHQGNRFPDRIGRNWPTPWNAEIATNQGPLALTLDFAILFHETMPDAAVIAASPLADEKGTGTTTDRLAALIMPLRAIIDAFPVEPPEPFDGETWLYFDSAMTGLYGALAALQDIERMHHGADQPICTHLKG